MGTKEIVEEKIIEVLTNNSNKKWYINRLADELELNPSTVHVYIKRMKEEGKVSTYKLPGSRAKYIKLTKNASS